MDELIDVNVSLSRWPFRRLPGDETQDLVALCTDDDFAVFHEAMYRMGQDYLIVEVTDAGDYSHYQ